ncbi:hypothetical protein [Alicyclobacillus fodiniaquatilis]|uniref:DUF4179 domain-containing protein n=1 Tax=Alicyclobacillus fodiniaquatilis TaxID=1661150 RepID=A0ABW4JBU5_9BACL
MVDSEDQEMRDLMKQLTDVPFRDELRARILTEVRAAQTPVPKGRKRRLWGRYTAMVSSLVAAGLFCAFMVDQKQQHQQAPVTTAKRVPYNASSTEFGLAQAPVQIVDMHIGTHPGDPWKDGEVLAELKNTSNQPVASADMFGVLSFSPKSTPNQENWITIVNGPNQTIQPGQTVKWWFHPSGSVLRSGSGDQLTEVPHLSFYASHLVAPSQADTVWKRSGLAVNENDLYVQPYDLGNGQQSVQVNAKLTNTTKKTIDLHNVLAVIWFASSDKQSFVSQNSIRFMYHVTPQSADDTWPTVVKPNQTVKVNFVVLSDMSSDFFSRTPHVIIIDDPQQTS